MVLEKIVLSWLYRYGTYIAKIIPTCSFKRNIWNYLFHQYDFQKLQKYPSKLKVIIFLVLIHIFE